MKSKQTFCYFHDAALSWADGRAKCQANGGDYIMVKTQAEQTEYNAIFGGLTDSRWLDWFKSEREFASLYFYKQRSRS